MTFTQFARFAPLLLIGGAAGIAAVACSGSDESCQSSHTCSYAAPDAGMAGNIGFSGSSGESGGTGISGSSGFSGDTSLSGSSGESAGMGGEAGMGPSGMGAGTSAAGNTAIGAAGSASGNGTLPIVVSITPGDRATGVVSTSLIHVTFNETMNTAATSKAVQLTGFPSSEISWDATGTVLTITPSGGLPYATGSTLAGTTAKSFSVSIGSGATDLAGNALAPFSASFQTLRKITQVIASGNAAFDTTYGHAYGDAPVMCPLQSALKVYTWTNMANGGISYAFVPFDLSALGDSSQITQIQSASFSATQSAPTGDFYSKHSVILDKLPYQAIDQTTITAAPTDHLGTLVTSATTTKPALSVLTLLKADLAAGATHELYRLAPTGSADPDPATLANFTCGGFALTVVFTEP